MAKVVVIKNLAELPPSMANIILSSMLGDSTIEKYDPDKTYNAGDKVYIIEDGKIIIKEFIGGNSSDIDGNGWADVDSGIGGSSTTQNPNSHQSISYFENKLAEDINTIVTRLNTLTNLDNLKNVTMVPLFSQDEVQITKGKYEFGRIFI